MFYFSGRTDLPLKRDAGSGRVVSVIDLFIHHPADQEEDEVVESASHFNISSAFI